MRRFAAPLALLFALALAPAANAVPRGPLSHEGRWITDRSGRVVILHGVNFVSKVGSYRPEDAGLGPEDARFMKRAGFNTVRLGLIYAGVEPKPGKISQPYIDSVARSERVLARKGIFSMLDFHQDLYNERFQGEGWPDWAVQDEGLPAVPQNGFPANYFAMVALWRAYDHFWANDPAPDGVGLQDHYAKAWRTVAKRFRNRRHVMGYDLLNEPFPGTPWTTCANPAGCPVSDAQLLDPFNLKVIDQIRRVDQTTLAFYEPWVVFDFGADTALADTGDPNAGLSFHDYCLPGGLGAGTLPAQGDACGVEEGLPFQNAEDHIAATGDTSLLTEFSATNDEATNDRLVDMADDEMVGWQIWHYCECDDPTTQAAKGVQSIVIDATKPPKGDNVNREKLKVIARPYPRAVAGTPTSYGFDLDTKTFDLAYDAKDPTGQATPRRKLTEVFLPKIQYRKGYIVQATGAKVVSRQKAHVLKLKRSKGATQVSVTVTPP